MELRGDDDRIAIQRLRVLERKRARNNAAIRTPLESVARALLSLPPELPLQLKRGYLTKASLESCVFEIDDLELLAGRPVYDPRTALGAEALDASSREALKALPSAPGQTGHCELDLSWLFKSGISGMLEGLRTERACDEEGAWTLKSFSLALEGLSSMIRNAGACVEKALSGAGAARKAELAELAASCERIASEPPRSFIDALHLVWFVSLAVQYAGEAWLVVPGRLDRRLIGFYREDLASGALTEAKALLLLENLYLLLNGFVPDGLATSIMVGGRGPDGEDSSNELSYLCLEALRRSKLCYPTVGVCWSRKTPEALTDLAVELVAKGYATPAFFGDEAIQRGMRSYGLSAAEASEYVNSTCVEITPCGSSNVWVASPYFNLCKTLLEEIAAEASSPRAKDFEDFTESCFARLSRSVADAVELVAKNRRLRARDGGKPLQSVFTRDCVGRGRDVDRGGASCNWVECSFVGIANFVDSLLALKRVVFEKGLPIASFKAVLDSNFEGREALRQEILNSCPKYGTADACADALAGRVVARLSSECALHRTPPDASPFIPGAFCWIMHERLGGECGATPDGRLAGTPFADGAGPAQGRELEGPTASVLSTSSWDHSRMLGGTALNMKFSASLFQGPQGVASLKSLILTYLERGGLETQVNVVDRETLLKAKARPEDYGDLVVRIGGYTDYFARLSPGMQDEVVSRTEFQRF